MHVRPCVVCVNIGGEQRVYLSFCILLLVILTFLHSVLFYLCSAQFASTTSFTFLPQQNKDCQTHIFMIINREVFSWKLASCFVTCYNLYVFATLGFILDSQSSWESCRFYLARWNHGVALFLEDPGHPPTLPTANV